MSEALRNVSLDHKSSNTYQKHYLTREIAADTWAIIRGQQPQKALIQQAGSVGHSISKRRPTELTPEQAASVSVDPVIRRLEQKLRGLRRGSEAYKETRKKVRSEKIRLKRKLKQKIRAEWTPKQAVEDVEQQLMGVWQPTIDRPCQPVRPSQEILVKSISTPSDGTLQGEYQRRNLAIGAVIRYCAVKEGPVIRQTIQPTEAPSQDETTNIPSAESVLHVALRSIRVKNDEERPKRCFICVGNALSVPSDIMEVKRLTHEFYAAGDLSKHFKRMHLSKLKEGDGADCRVCMMTLQHKLHFQAHALRVHGLIS